jgi:hypothetical protein
MKFAVVSLLISIAFESQAFAVLRPFFPTKPEPPFRGAAMARPNFATELKVKHLPQRLVE